MYPLSEASISKEGGKGSLRPLHLYIQMVSDYHAIRMRLLNSQELLEGTSLALYDINQTTLVLWSKNKTRREETSMLMQGINLPTPSPCSSTCQLPPNQRPTTPPPTLGDLHAYPDARDTTGMAAVRAFSEADKFPPPPSISEVGAEAEVTTVTVSRTTEWRRRKRATSATAVAAGSGGGGGGGPDPSAGGPTKRPRKEYSCNRCKKSISGTGHTQYFGKRYCPELDTVSKEQWLANRKAEAAATTKADK